MSFEFPPSCNSAPGQTAHPAVRGLLLLGAVAALLPNPPALPVQANDKVVEVYLGR